MIDRSFASLVHDFDAGLARAILYLGAVAHLAFRWIRTPEGHCGVGTRLWPRQPIRRAKVFFSRYAFSPFGNAT
jgi:hypothetical protein